MDDEQFIDLVDRLTDEKFLNFVEQFVQENSAVFANPVGEEHLHCYHTLHLQYQRLFESKAEAWLREKQLGPEALALAARDGEGLARDLVESLLAVSDYQAFVELMQRVARQCEADSCTGEASPARHGGYTNSLAPP